MKRFVLAVLMFAFFSCVAFGADKEVRTIFEMFVAPESIDEMAAEADTIVRARVLGNRSVAGQKSFPPVYTEHRLRILDVIRGWVPSDRQVIADHPVLQELLILQKAGEVETNEQVIKMADEIPLSPGAEYVLFLKWNPGYDRYEVWLGRYGIFRIENDVVHPGSDFRTVNSAKGKPVTRFIEELRGRKQVRP